MIKRIILINLAFLLSLVTFGQEIKFKLENTEIKLVEEIPEDGVTLPLIMIFPKEFKGKEIELNDLEERIIYSGAFGKDKEITKTIGDADYFFKIDEKGKIKEVSNPPNISVNEDGFTINLIGSRDPPIQINFKKSDGQKEKIHIPGYLLYDAIYISENLVLGQPNGEIEKILASYDIDSVKIKDNQYLNEQLSDVFTNFQSRGGFGDKKSLLSSVGGINVTTVADGFAKFIVKRTKQELTIAFFEKFKKKLDSIKDLQTVFPQTAKVLGAIGNEIYMFKAYIQTLKEAFEKDLATLPSNLPKIIDNHKEFFNANPELKAGLRTSFYIAQSFQEKLHPGVIIENYKHELWSDSNPNYQAAFQTLILFSTSLKSQNDADNYWAPKSDLEKLYINDGLFEIYLGLLVQNARKEEIIFKGEDGKSLELSKIIDSSSVVVSDVNHYKTYIKKMYQKVQSLDAKVKQLKDPTNEASALENYYSIISASIDLMEDAVKIESLPHFPEGMNIQEKSKKYFNIVQTSADIVIDISKKNYASVVLDATDLYSIIFEKISIQKYADSISRKAEKNKMAAKEEKKNIDATESNNEETTTYKEAKTEAEFNEIKKALFTYGTFIAAVARAKTSDEVESAIEAFALPAGSARIKRETHFNISLNAYCGLFSGVENIKGLEKGKWNSYGVTAPIGISISRGHSIFFFGTGKEGWEENKKGWSSSLFFSIVDIGALTAFRFANDTVESVPNIKLKDIISPGVFISIGFPKSPISFNAGWQVGPLLRKVNLEENTFDESYTRFSVSLTVDIPILNFYTKK